MLSLLRSNRDLSIFLGTQALSYLGDAATALLLPLIVLQLTHRPLLVAAVAALALLPFLMVRLPFGAKFDRLEGRRSLVVAEVGTGLLTLLIPIAALLHGPVLLVIFVVTVPLSILEGFCSAGVGSLTPRIAAREYLTKVYSLVEATESLAWVAGPLLAGLVAVAYGAATGLAIDGVSFFILAAGLSALRSEPLVTSTAVGSVWQDVRSGLGYFLQHSNLRRAQLAWTMYTAIGSGIVLGLIYVATANGTRSTSRAALAVAAYAAGSAGGTLIAGVRSPQRHWLGIASGFFVLAAGAGLVSAGGPLLEIAGALLFGLGEGFALVVFLVIRADGVPVDFMSRIAGVSEVLGSVATSVGVAWMGVTLQFLHGSGAFLVVAVLALGLASWTALGSRKPQPSSAS
ncbi:MAG: MFS transporter [Candidatus Dormiibacterota bacterium]